MGAGQSDSLDEEFVIPDSERWRHNKCSVRAPH